MSPSYDKGLEDGKNGVTDEIMKHDEDYVAGQKDAVRRKMAEDSAALLGSLGIADFKVVATSATDHFSVGGGRFEKGNDRVKDA